MSRYARPTTLDEALSLLSQDSWRLLAGGTDFYPAQGNIPIQDNVLDLNAIAELRSISEAEDHYRFGARTTWSDIAQAHLPAAFDGLRSAAREIGSIQIQNAGTIAGNLCNASPAADGVPPLLTLDALAELRSTRGTRQLPLPEFILGNRATARAKDELVTAILVPRKASVGASFFLKLGTRRYLVISIAMAAVRLVLDGDTIGSVAVSVGSCSATARRLTRLERNLEGRSVGEISRVVATAQIDEIAPIDDVRANAAYRMEAVREIVTRALLAVGPTEVAA